MEKQKIIENFKKQIIENYSDQTIKNYLSVLKLFLEWVEKRNSNVNELTNEEVKDYLFYCKNDKRYAFSTMVQVITTISFLFGKVLDKPIPKALDIKLKKPTLIPTVLSAKDISKILEVTKNLKHKTSLLLMYSAGLRLGELLNLKIGDIDSESMKIHVRRAKGKKDRYIMLSENVLNLLSEYYKIYKPKEYIIEGIKGGKYSPQSVQTLFKTALKKAGIKKKATVHSLRHSFATHLMDEGTDIRYIQELLGHKRLETTQIYTHISSFTIDKIKSPADKLKLIKSKNYMRNYSYKCFNCQTEYSAEKVESKFIYLCPKCGTAKKNKPLRGVLTVEYNYDKIKDEFSKEDLLKLKPGKFWQYPFLFPVDFGKFSKSVLLRLSLPEVQLFEYEINGRKVLVQDETRNPTLSYKDRATSLVTLKAMELGITEIAAASTGNAGSSLAGICARLGLKSIVYVPKNIPDAKRIQISAYGAKLEVVNGDYDLAFDKCLEDSAINKWYNRNTAYNPLTIEGKKSAAFDIFISTKGNLPDYIFVPVGDGVIISGIYKGFKELFELGWIEKLPKLIAVQSVKSDAVVRYLNNSKFEYKSADTIADSISAGAPRNLYMAADSVEKSDGFGIAVTDKEILQAQKEFIKKTGILCEPSSAAVFAAYKNIIKENRIDCNEKILLLITGNGLKDIASLQN